MLHDLEQIFVLLLALGSEHTRQSIDVHDHVERRVASRLTCLDVCLRIERRGQHRQTACDDSTVLSVDVLLVWPIAFGHHHHALRTAGPLGALLRGALVPRVGRAPQLCEVLVVGQTLDLLGYASLFLEVSRANAELVCLAPQATRCTRPTLCGLLLCLLPLLAGTHDLVLSPTLTRKEVREPTVIVGPRRETEMAGLESHYLRS